MVGKRCMMPQWMCWAVVFSCLKERAIRSHPCRSFRRSVPWWRAMRRPSTWTIDRDPEAAKMWRPTLSSRPWSWGWDLQLFAFRALKTKKLPHVQTLTGQRRSEQSHPSWFRSGWLEAFQKTLANLCPLQYLPKGGGPYCLVFCVKNLHLQLEVLCFLYENRYLWKTCASCANLAELHESTRPQTTNRRQHHQGFWKISSFMFCIQMNINKTINELPKQSNKAQQKLPHNSRNLKMNLFFLFFCGLWNFDS